MKICAHLTDSIIAKLDSDLSDSERESFLQILVDSPQTLELLNEVTVTWEKQLEAMNNVIKTLKKDSDPKYVSIGSVASTNQSAEKDVSTLTKQQLAYEKSAKNEEISLCFLDELLNPLFLIIPYLFYAHTALGSSGTTNSLSN